MDSTELLPFLYASGLPAEQQSALFRAFSGAKPADRIAAVEALLSRGGTPWRRQIGRWIAQIIPVDFLVPQVYERWRALVEDAMQFVFSRLSADRLAAKLMEQMELPGSTPPEQRLLRLIGKMPGLQKLGQVLARNRRLAPSLARALAELENGLTDMTPAEVRAIIEAELGARLRTYAVELDSSIYKEGSASAVVRFTWQHPGRERQRGVFKVLKPHVPGCFAEDMTLLQELGEYLAATDRGYGFAVADVKEMLAEVRTLLEHELDFAQEQATLMEARRLYRSCFGVRVPQVIEPLCTSCITAMSEEMGVKVTDAAPHSLVRRARIAGQLIEALLAVPLFSRQDPAVFHADPHAGNLMYDEPNRELLILDWALTERLSLEARRRLILLALMMILRNRAGVRDAIQGLSRGGQKRRRERLIARLVDRYFDRLPAGFSPGTLDAMMLMDEVALHGVRFPASLFVFRKIVFTLDGVLHDITGGDVRIDTVVTRHYLTRWIASFGVFSSPLVLRDFMALPWNALRCSGRALSRRLPVAPVLFVSRDPVGRGDRRAQRNLAR
jgi:ubiquinone biosynthesis protein